MSSIMKKYKSDFRIEDGNLFWDKTCCRIIIIGDDDENVYDEKCHIAFPIPLNEDVLTAIGFISNNNASYVNKDGIIVNIDGICNDGILKCFDSTVHFVSDLQNICSDNHHKLKLNEYIGALMKTCKQMY